MNKKQVILHTGSNLGDRHLNLEIALRQISGRIGPILKTSSIYQTQAWGIREQPDFLNQAMIAETHLPPHAVLREVLQIEQSMGRRRTSKKWLSRLIDIDLIFYEQEIINTSDLTVPHPFMHERNFVLAPLFEINPQKIHPVLNKSVKELLEQSADPLLVEAVEMVKEM